MLDADMIYARRLDLYNAGPSLAARKKRGKTYSDV